MHSKDIARIYTDAIKWIIDITQAKPKLLCIHSNNDTEPEQEDTKYYFQSIQRTCEKFGIAVQQESLFKVIRDVDSAYFSAGLHRYSPLRPKEDILKLHQPRETRLLQVFREAGIHGAIIGQPIPPHAAFLLQISTYPDIEGMGGSKHNLHVTPPRPGPPFGPPFATKITHELMLSDHIHIRAELERVKKLHLYPKYTEYIKNLKDKDEEKHILRFRELVIHELMCNITGGTHFDELIPPTVLSVIELLRFYEVHLEGKDVCILGRSMIVGAPLARLMTKCDATVTICHSKTKDIEKHIQRADIVISAIGKPRFVQGAWIKEGAVVVDVGTSVVDGKLVGDVDETARIHAKLVTPVPGGVGALTNLMLIKNLLYRYFEFEN